ncbi:DnaJ-like protein [Zancudomyces culisetae]|uniref:DnaJ-like protein n=1 Tax=Zancudomyces culisetae TaxID=1213189 RepID=A0A1R1PUZ9_ZANCU|nr:DnaJ-like protein [Zancudomyces culisetae]|eukprot:OMH84788.1 DnaJ-like protein [Zancudomyces culisetae]
MASKIDFDPYKVLELEYNASIKDISRAYKRLALMYHPDRSTIANSEEKFVEIKKAFDFLSIDENRAIYLKKYERNKLEQLKNKKRYEMKMKLEREEFLAKNKSKAAEPMEETMITERDKFFKKMRKSFKNPEEENHEEVDDEINRTVKIIWNPNVMANVREKDLFEVASEFGDVLHVLLGSRAFAHIIFKEEQSVSKILAGKLDNFEAIPVHIRAHSFDGEGAQIRKKTPAGGKPDIQDARKTFSSLDWSTNPQVKSLFANINYRDMPDYNMTFSQFEKYVSDKINSL